MDVRAARADDLARIREMLIDGGWRARAQDVERLAAIIEAADRSLVVEIDGGVVAFGRAVTDGVSNGYLSMVVVDPAHRRRGVGRVLVAALTGDDDRVTWVLRAGHPESEPFWRAVGFTRSTIAMERSRRR